MISARLKETRQYGVVKFYTYALGDYIVEILDDGEGGKHYTNISKGVVNDFLPTISLPEDTANGDYGISLRPYQPMTPERTEKVIKGYQIALEVVDYLKTHKLN